MIQPKYSPKEALQKMKLMMEYDTSKTLDENKKLLNEEPLSLMAITGIILGSAAAITAAATWIGNITGGGDAIEKTRVTLEGCQAVTRDLKPKLSPAEIDQYAREIYDGVSYKIGGIFLATDEEKVKNAFSALPTLGDICAVKKQYEIRYGANLFDDLDSDFDGEEFRKYVWLPIEDVILKSNEALQNMGGGTTTSSKASDKEYWRSTFNCLVNYDSFDPDTVQIRQTKTLKYFIPIVLKVKGQVRNYNLREDGRLIDSATNRLTNVTISCQTEDKVRAVISESKIVRISEQAEINIEPKVTELSVNDGGGGGNNRPARNRKKLQIPEDLISSGGVKKFQDWVVSKGYSSELGPYGADGKFGKYTNNAWNKYKNEYLKSPTEPTSDEVEVDIDVNDV